MTVGNDCSISTKSFLTFDKTRLILEKSVTVSRKQTKFGTNHLQPIVIYMTKLNLESQFSAPNPIFNPNRRVLTDKLTV